MNHITTLTILFDVSEDTQIAIHISNNQLGADYILESVSARIHFKRLVNSKSYDSLSTKLFK